MRNPGQFRETVRTRGRYLVLVNHALLIRIRACATKTLGLVGLQWRPIDRVALRPSVSGHLNDILHLAIFALPRAPNFDVPAGRWGIEGYRSLYYLARRHHRRQFCHGRTGVLQRFRGGGSRCLRRSKLSRGRRTSVVLTFVHGVRRVELDDR